MRKRSIVTKLFAITALLLLIFFSMQFIFQYFWLEKFYIYNKNKEIIQNVSMLKEKLEKDLLNDKEINKLLMILSEENNASSGIVNIYGIPKYGLNGGSNVSHIKIKDSKDDEYLVYIEKFLRYPDFQKLLQNKKNINITGRVISGKEKEIYPATISIDDKTFGLQSSDTEAIVISERKDNDNETKRNVEENEQSSDYKKTYVLIPAVVEIDGIIENIQLMEQKDYVMEYKKNQLMKEVSLFLQENKDIKALFSNSELVHYVKVDPITGIKNIIFVQPVFLNNEEPTFMFTLTSLQSITEAIDIMKLYFFIIFLIVLAAAVIASYFYSKLITKPLLQINKVTKQMARLDFSNQCNMKKEDEIGELAKNINSLSVKLKEAKEKLETANQKLLEDIEVKEKVEQFRKEFIANVSHELKTPLTVAKGICEGIRDGIYDSNNAEYISQILNEINGMNGLVYNLLQSSKIQIEVQPLKNEIFQLSDVILKVHNRFKTFAKDKKIQVMMELTDEFVMADEDKIETVIGNLYSNSIKYSSTGEKIRIKMETKQEQCMCTIENSGVKIPKEELLNIWEPFYRIEKSRNKELGGSGLGLYIVKQILDKHKSKYGIQNTEWGVKVYFSLTKIDTDFKK
ncbi:sensor histidine kinase [Abyssisolibacter fermentans]|uniref:sensor histidine kinase n=1 Tax=Abyssisolibacter fermentans TaxID=1766203 RepID=UPI0008305626|nr:ATP-binding protein [Abyssisolibacter fermentans]